MTALERIKDFEYRLLHFMTSTGIEADLLFLFRSFYTMREMAVDANHYSAANHDVRAFDLGNPEDTPESEISEEFEFRMRQSERK